MENFKNRRGTKFLRSQTELATCTTFSKKICRCCYFIIYINTWIKYCWSWKNMEQRYADGPRSIRHWLTQIQSQLTQQKIKYWERKCQIILSLSPLSFMALFYLPLRNLFLIIAIVTIFKLCHIARCKDTTFGINGTCRKMKNSIINY